MPIQKVSADIPPRNPRSQRRTTVTLNESANTIHSFDNDASLLHPDRIWYQPDDYAGMKVRSRADAREARKQGFGCLLVGAFESTRPDVQIRLNAFVKLEDEQSRRGLERFLSREHGDERIDGKDRARSSVVIHQEQLRRDNVQGDKMTRALATVYSEAVRSATFFARRMGIADELVVKEGEDSTVALEFVDAHMEGKKKRPIERRLSNLSTYSVQSEASQASLDSRRRVPWRRTPAKNCPPPSPSSASEEFYAAIA
jgi:hypothetical protein